MVCQSVGSWLVMRASRCEARFGTRRCGQIRNRALPTTSGSRAWRVVVSQPMWVSRGTQVPGGGAEPEGGHGPGVGGHEVAELGAGQWGVAEVVVVLTATVGEDDRVTVG